MTDLTARPQENPGSPAAILLGCKCPVIDNGRGRGGYVDVDGRPQFWITDGCPVHVPIHA